MSVFLRRAISIIGYKAAFIAFAGASPLLLASCTDVHFEQQQPEASGIVNDDNENELEQGFDDIDDGGGYTGNTCEITKLPEHCTAVSYRDVVSEFTVSGTTKLDVLVVADSSGSMETERKYLGDRLSDFIGNLGQIDWRVCVTTTNVQAQDGKLLPFDNGSKVLSPANANASTLFQLRLNRIVKEFNGSGDEQGIHSMIRAFQRRDPSCFRDDSALATIILSDEDERSTGGYDDFRSSGQFRELRTENFPTTAVQTVAQIWGPQKIFTNHSIVIRPGDAQCWAIQHAQADAWYGTRYLQLTKLTGGILGNICAADYSSQLKDFAAQIKNTLASVTMECVPPENPAVVLTPDQPGTVVARAGNKMLFNPPLPDGTMVRLSYRCPNI